MEAIYMSPHEAGERYNLSRKVIYELINMPESPRTLKVGHRRLIPIALWDEFMEEHFEVERK